ncbi:DUF4180 domain-containing protein [Enterococcus xiangfangensis]|uniref:DUF4180 domain-containing protein n=1 Tax=Enterococcus xiangfangensis TaxID=1296537 RepID=A0ABU3FAP5_9ENTE|nr:DUF4180 domain-containing protein [Enterococcus xiangfangensis]MBM7711304.1 hypothetical protein [Enterococcus xiangfangensis]MDT2759501.1 DUF4180 domain-containing protein [Enterococcus xiangfangensis]NBK09061.1 DUF4180 domain-containing protein [Enterococcus asini]
MVVVRYDKEEPIIFDKDSALDFAMTIDYQYGTSNIILPKDAISSTFFDLSSQLAGEILQAYINYDVRLAIVGDFSEGSKALKDFIRESNKGSNFYFVPNLDEAISYLSK